MKVLSGSYLRRITCRSVVWPRTLIALFRGCSYFSPEQCTNKSASGASWRTRGRSIPWTIAAGADVRKRIDTVGSARREGIARDMDRSVS